jgi:GTP-binding protein Era
LTGAGKAQRCGVVAVVGAPNAGKSTLVNALVGEKVAIVSPKVQTTRARLMGIAVAGETQLLLVDTPGIFAPRRRLDRAMVQAAWEGASGADVVLLVVDARRGLTAEVTAILDTLARRSDPRMLALNKVDITPKARLLPLAASLNQRVEFLETFMVAAKPGDGVEDLKATLAAAMPAGPWHFPADQLTDATQRLLAAELTREQLYLQLSDELPYASMVETETWETGHKAITVRQIILVERDSQKAIVLGKGGARIKAIGEAARRELEALVGRRVHLFLHVKVKPGWAEDRETLREMGLGWVD